MNETNVFEDLRQILIHGMSLEETRVNIFNQRISEELLEKPGLFVYIECLPSRVISSRSKYWLDPISGEYKEVLDVNMLDPVLIGIFSRNLEALQRKDEVLMALNSHYAQQLQEAHSFKIFRNAPIQDMSVLEGAALLYRYDIPVQLFSWSQKITTVDYFNVFKGEVKVNDGLPIITKDFEQELSSSSCSSSSS